MWNKVHGKVSESSQIPRIMHTVTHPHTPFHYRGGWGRILGPAPGLLLELLGRADAPLGVGDNQCFASTIRNLGPSQMVLVVKNPPANARDVRDTGSIPGSKGSPGEGNRNPLQCSCLGNGMDRGPIEHGVAKRQTRLSN